MTGLVRVPDNGFELLIARLTGEIDPGLLVLLPVTEVRFTTVECIEPDGTVTRTRRLISDEERREVVEFAEEYLTDAGVAPFPRDMGVYLTLPAGVDSMDEMAGRLLVAMGEQPIVPSQLAAKLRLALHYLYR